MKGKYSPFSFRAFGHTPGGLTLAMLSPTTPDSIPVKLDRSYATGGRARQSTFHQVLPEDFPGQTYFLPFKAFKAGASSILHSPPVFHGPVASLPISPSPVESLI